MMMMVVVVLEEISGMISGLPNWVMANILLCVCVCVSLQPAWEGGIPSGASADKAEVEISLLSACMSHLGAEEHVLYQRDT